MEQKEIINATGQGKPQELSFGKKAIVKGWHFLIGTGGKDGIPLTGEAMGKKLLWGAGGALIGHFSGMSIVGIIITALTGILFNNNIKGMGSSVKELFQGKLSLSNKAVLAPILGGAAGFGLSAFGIHCGFLPSMLAGITGASLTDYFVGNQTDRNKKNEKMFGLMSNENKLSDNLEESKQSKQLGREHSNKLQENINLERKQSNINLQSKEMTDKELLSIANASPNGLEMVRNQFNDNSAFNDFILRNGLIDKISRDNAGHLGNNSQNITETQYQNIKIG